MAAAVSSSSSLAKIAKDEILNCPICKNRYDDPRLLWCGHTFCLGCLKRCLAAKKAPKTSIKCAMCRKITKLPSKKVETLNKSRTLIGIMDLMKECAPTPKRGAGGRKPISTGESKSNAKPPNKATSKDKPKPVPVKDRNHNDSMDCFDGEFTPDDDSSDDDSSDDESSLSSETSSGDDEEDSSEEDDCPPTPGIQIWGGIQKGQKVFIFGSRGRRAVGKVQVIEQVKRTVFCGVELEEEMPWLICKEFDKMTDTYLHHWLGDHEKPCTVVKVDQCCPMALIEDIQSQH